MTDPLAGVEALDGLSGFRVLQSLASGPSADAWVLGRGDERVVLRRDRPLARRLGLDRAAEWNFLEQAFAAGMAPEPLFHDPVKGVLLTRFLPGASWDQAEPAGAGRWTELGRLLRRVHDLPGVTGKRFDLVAIAARYAQVAASHRAAELERQVARQVPPLYAEAPWCLCHHDAHLGNVVGGAEAKGVADDVRGAPPYLLDWEYAALGHPLFDLAVVIGFHGLEGAPRAQLVGGWTGEGRPPDEAALQAFCTLYRTVADLWALAVGPAAT